MQSDTLLKRQVDILAKQLDDLKRSHNELKRKYAKLTLMRLLRGKHN
jgi:phage shock protein A